MDWSKYENFSEDELRCSHTSECFMDEDFMKRLQMLRSDLGVPLKITSGYRHTTHPIEAAKSKAGEHTLGKAVDIACRGQLAYTIMEAAPSYGFIRIGFKQNGDGRFIHLGTATWDDGFPSPWIWSY